MALSGKTTTIIASVLIAPEDDLYPDRNLDDGAITTGTPIPRLPSDQVPTTTQDMSKAFQWLHGEDLYGAFAKDSKALADQRRDINTAWGNESDYKDLYIDTMTPNKTIQEQLNRWKK